jgi:Beta-lactamase enzyme family
MAAGLSAAIAAMAPVAAAAGVHTLNPLRHSDPELTRELTAIASELGIMELARVGRASLAVVDLLGTAGTSECPAYAGIAADTTLGAASVAKLGILVAAFAAATAGDLEITPDVRATLERMIRDSANPEASRMIEILGFEGIAAALEDPRIALHHPETGGLWVGKSFGIPQAPVWRAEPCSGEPHAASAASVARLYGLLDQGQLVSRAASDSMRAILAVTYWDHKFVAGLRGLEKLQAKGAAPAARSPKPVTIPGYQVLRKSGSFGPWQADSALIEGYGRRYILVCLLADRAGGEAKLQKLAARVDQLMAVRHPLPPITAATAAEPPPATP